MCMADACLTNGVTEETILEDVATLRVEGGEIVLETLFGDRQSIIGEVQEIDFANSKILLRRSEEE